MERDGKIEVSKVAWLVLIKENVLHMIESKENLRHILFSFSVG